MTRSKITAVLLVLMTCQFAIAIDDDAKKQAAAEDIKKTESKRTEGSEEATEGAEKGADTNNDRVGESRTQGDAAARKEAEEMAKDLMKLTEATAKWAGGVLEKMPENPEAAFQALGKGIGEGTLQANQMKAKAAMAAAKAVMNPGENANGNAMQRGLNAAGEVVQQGFDGWSNEAAAYDKGWNYVKGRDGYDANSAQVSMRQQGDGVAVTAKATDGTTRVVAAGEGSAAEFGGKSVNQFSGYNTDASGNQQATFGGERIDSGGNQVVDTQTAYTANVSATPEGPAPARLAAGTDVNAFTANNSGENPLSHTSFRPSELANLTIEQNGGATFGEGAGQFAVTPNGVYGSDGQGTWTANEGIKTGNKPISVSSSAGSPGVADSAPPPTNSSTGSRSQASVSGVANPAPSQLPTSPNVKQLSMDTASNYVGKQVIMDNTPYTVTRLGKPSAQEANLGIRAWAYLKNGSQTPRFPIRALPID